MVSNELGNDRVFLTLRAGFADLGAAFVSTETTNNMKRDLTDWHGLAIFGGVPIFSEPLHVGRPNIPPSKSVLALINDALERKWLTNDGPMVRKFEKAVAENIKIDHCIALSSGTSAIELLVEGMDLKGEVIVPSFTFIATVHALVRKGLRPRFCDVLKDNHTLDPECVGSLIGESTSAILGVHLWGRPCSPRKLRDIADRHGIRLIYDGAHAFGCGYMGRMLASYGDAAVLSFHATKIVNTFEGGAVVTNDPDLAGRLRLLRNFGFDESGQVVALGTNAKMNEAEAAMGLASLQEMENTVNINRCNFEHYMQALSGVPGINLLCPEKSGESTYQYVVTVVDDSAAGLTRDEILAILWAENIRARRYFHPGCHRVPPHVKSAEQIDLPVTDSLTRRVLCLPTGASLTKHDIDLVASVLRVSINASDSVRAGLKHYLDDKKYAYL